MRFSLIIPCYNEGKNLPLLIDKCGPLLRNPNIEIILVNNGSTDDTGKTLSKISPKCSNFTVVSLNENIGYGHGILSGLKVAKGKILGWTHADMQTDPSDALRGLELFESHGDQIFVKGNRTGRAMSDQFFTFGMSLFETLLMRQLLWDINAQPTMFSREFYLTWSSPPKDFSLDLFVYVKARIQKLMVYRVKVLFPPRQFGVSNWNVDWHSKTNFIRRTLKYSLHLRKKIRDGNHTP
tara:strand:- start:556 stop:1269 length:714 start_codon:yes stop_codon:yes gene_type:complete